MMVTTFGPGSRIVRWLKVDKRMIEICGIRGIEGIIAGMGRIDDRGRVECEGVNRVKVIRRYYGVYMDERICTLRGKNTLIYS